MNPNLSRLQPYPFEKLAQLKQSAQPPEHLPHIALSIGEPKHAPPEFALDVLRNNMSALSRYPTTKGEPELRQAIASWLEKRFSLAGGIDPESQVLPVNGTREALFAFAQAVIDPTQDALVVSPNPFYQIYEGAAYLAGAEPYFLPCDASNGFIPDFDSVPSSIWRRCQLLFLCSPGNPTGRVLPVETLQKLISLADEYNFIIASDECYSEIYFDEPAAPIGLLEACAKLGRHDYRRCVVFHSLSKRSNVPGLRSGFVAGDANILREFLRYRTYHGCSMPIPTQLASIALWSDEEHVRQNRAQYVSKFHSFKEILAPCWPLEMPDAAFYFWAQTPIPDDIFAQRLYAEKNLTVLPGRFLGREQEGVNPGAGRIRMALVASEDECIEAAQRIKSFIESL
ncbi:succinyldiaminopimelate transaminase [Hahella sp. CR1]|uniref:succinyldiaminopimelate transaminase n=1 Tax=Hahella sp. CR1 TaxID=2992807 RepID=UPI002442E586|nr:succinyldiaminopimelate transaminase [Hahella sp. CR1]MDG9668268.1 succinyldiaminopimelate transaminase [Hahella sp. CR1]